MRIPERLLSTVGFIANSSKPDAFLGTGFIVGVNSGPKQNRLIFHIVTAKHNVINRKEGAVFVTRTETGKRSYSALPKDTWVFHPTEADCVDVAASLLFGPLTNSLPGRPAGIDSALFAVGDRLKEYPIGLGDEVTMVGLFSGFSGNEYHEPLLRTGNLAMMPMEKVPHNTYGSVYAHLVESRSTGGLSGSPAFVRNSVYLSGFTGPTTPMAHGGEIHLLGLVMGHYEIGRQAAEPINMGVVLIAPAQKILETLHHPLLVEARSLFDNHPEYFYKP